MTPDIIIVGTGETLDEYDWSDEADVCAVSGAIYHCRRKPKYWVAFDSPEFYHEFRERNDIEKHIRTYRPIEDQTPEWYDDTYDLDPEKPYAGGWENYGYTKAWTIFVNPLPQLTPHGSGNRLNTGLCGNAPSSMIGAVQIMAQEGYKRMLFVGCDYINYGLIIWNTMKVWLPHFERAGIEWKINSPKSFMGEFCPVREESAVG